MKSILQKTVLSIAITGIFLFNVSEVEAQQKFQKATHVQDFQSKNLKSISAKFRSKALLNKEKAHSLARSKGWEVSKKLPNGGYMELEKVGPDGAPIYFTTFNFLSTQWASIIMIIADIIHELMHAFQQRSRHSDWVNIDMRWNALIH